MIEKMKKYSFVLYHLDYTKFLSRLQDLGMVHIIRSCDDKTPELIQNHELIGEYAEAVKYLTRLNSTASKTATNLPTKAVLNKVNSAREERESLVRHEETIKKNIRELLPWNHFDYKLVSRIRNAGIGIDFHYCLKNHFKSEWQDQYAIRIIGERSGILYFVVLYSGDSPALEADTFSFHQHTLQEFEQDQAHTLAKINDIDTYLQGIAPTAIELFETEIKRLSSDYDYVDATLQGISEADDHLRILSGWIPVSAEPKLREFIQSENVIHFVSEAKVEENPPVSLKNGWFARLFEPISKMYMLPKYGEFDLTPFLAPFFMLFFGFCNADIGYGIAIIAIALFLKWKAKNDTMKDFMNLILLFGIASIIMGILVGSLMGYDLKELPGIGERILIRNNDQIFNLALLLGVIQILFGIGISAVKKIHQSGFVHGLSTIGTFLFIASLSFFGAAQLGTDISAVAPYLKYPMWSGLALILLFNQPGKNPIINILGGLWLLYNIVTGFFGDILSYIRLFALGVSSAILGFVVNSIGAQLSGTPVIGPVIFILFMLFGHGLNLALGGLSGFVHPMRLTFVEFFKNAAFEGPGTPYKPFAKH
ncbi:MAG TPA: V-type ATPase 116kDa subunit family protein [Candidatus Cloacimonadota bacterium]|nr:V-type ATPase 116kDa subunit family protein [Candidatus Cloacimonadota bacterium]